MKFKEYLNEDVKNYKTLVNMIAVVSHKKDVEYIVDIVEKSFEKKLITDREYKKLQKELKELKKGVKL